METYSLLSIPFYKSVQQCYVKAIALDRMPGPNEPINKIIRRVRYEKLSPFQEGTECHPLKTCGNIVIKPGSQCGEMANLDDIPLIFTWLMQNGYQIDTSITQMINQGEVRMSSPIIGFITKKIQ
ncbi:MAG: hypothetical protein CMB96_04840 [Flavobacteriaceae bacterium]|nr:hypothetical protein [Flavobacteriaceae bacterium]|tara:strand:+ start:1507 stop:1881 length:375 start_codon:yes stop_codon:yes gene_type:complete